MLIGRAWDICAGTGTVKTVDEGGDINDAAGVDNDDMELELDGFTATAAG